MVTPITLRRGRGRGLLMAACVIVRCAGAMIAIAACGDASPAAGTMPAANAFGAAAQGQAGTVAAGSTGSQAGSTGSQAGSGGAAPGPNTFTALYTQVFTTCRRQICHGGAVAELDMSSQSAAYLALVNHPVQAGGMCAFTGMTRVVPFQPDQSLLIGKLEPKAPCGQQMPIGGLLSQPNRDMVRAWVQAGALND